MKGVTPSRWASALRRLPAGARAAARARWRRGGLHGRARLVGGQLQHRGRAGELLLPPGELALELLALQPLALPDGVVGVLHGQRGQRRGPALGEGRVEGGHLAHQHAHGPAVGDDVVHAPARSTCSESAGAAGWCAAAGRAPGRRAPGLLVGQAPHLGLALRGGQRRSGPRAPAPRGRRRGCAATGWPSSARKVVRSASWRRTSSARLRSSATSSGAASRTAAGMLYTGCPAASWSRNHSRCWAKDERARRCVSATPGRRRAGRGAVRATELRASSASARARSAAPPWAAPRPGPSPPRALSSTAASESRP